MNKTTVFEPTMPENFMLDQSVECLQTATQYTKKDYQAVCQRITQFTHHCQGRDYSRSEIDDARFFICALLDEMVQWKRSLLLSFYSSDVNKDHDFFTRLERCQNDPYKSIDLLELGYLCLSLGFQGKLRNESTEVMANLRASLYDKIREIREDSPASLLIEESMKKEKKFWRYPPISLTVSLTIIVILAIFIPYNKKLNTYKTSVLSALNKREKLTQVVNDLRPVNQVVKTD